MDPESAKPDGEQGAPGNAPTPAPFASVTPWVLVLLFLGIAAALYPHVRPQDPDEHLLPDWELDCRGKQRPDAKGLGCLTGCQLRACIRLCRTPDGELRDGYDWACERLERMRTY